MQTAALGCQPAQAEDAKQSQLERAEIHSKCLGGKELGSIDPKERLGKTKPILATTPGSCPSPAEPKDQGISYLRSGRREGKINVDGFQVYARRYNDGTRLGFEP
jgi:hypothetical protein